MSGQPWGRTGRVTIDADCVLVDDYLVGYVPGDKYAEVVVGLSDAPRRRGRPWARVTTRNDAVMWILRRTAPDVWRAERPVVWSVAAALYPRETRWWEWEGADWHKPANTRTNEHRTFTDAVLSADRNARAEYAVKADR